jgi:multicomponent Na+:H+ antiporter subunit E
MRDDDNQNEQTGAASVEAGWGAIVHGSGLAVSVAVVWLLLSGHYDPLLLSFGAASVILVVVVAWRMDVVDHEGVPVHLGMAALTYWPWLMVEVIKSNIDVSRRVFSRGPDISPTLVRVRASQRTELGHVVYANSITLTPGTVSMDLTGDWILVHAVSLEGAEALLEGEMDRRTTAMEGLD